MKPLEHIDVLLNECHRVQAEGHCRQPDEYVAINKIEIAIHELRQAFENDALMQNCKRKGFLLWKLPKILFRLIPGRR